MVSRVLRSFLILSLLICGSIDAQSLSACAKTVPGGPGGPVDPEIPNANLDFSFSCEIKGNTQYQGQICYFTPKITNPALVADLKHFDWNWGVTPPAVWRRYKIQEVRYEYPVADQTYLVQLTAVFHSGQTETVAKHVKVDVAEDSAHWGYNNYFWGSDIYIDTSVGHPTTHRYFWDFGDGTTSRNASHKCFCKNYEKPGLYTVTLTVINMSVEPATTTTKSRVVEVPNLAPEATFVSSNNHKTFSFDASGSSRDPLASKEKVL